MKIYNDPTDKLAGSVIDSKKNSRVKNISTDKTGTGEDTLEISSKAMDMSRMQKEAMSSPDVRQDKINNIKMQIENDSYEISSEKIAESLITDHILE